MEPTGRVSGKIGMAGRNGYPCMIRYDGPLSGPEGARWYWFAAASEGMPATNIVRELLVSA